MDEYTDPTGWKALGIVFLYFACFMVLVIVNSYVGFFD